MAQLALAWCLRLPSVSSVIVGASRGEQLAENVEAVGKALPAELQDRIDALFPAA